MNLVELYEQTPVEKHRDIVVSGDRVFLDDEEYVLTSDGELRLIHSDKESKADIKAIKSKLGITEVTP